MVRKGIDAQAQEAASGLDEAVNHMRQQLNIASGMYVWSRFRTTCTSLREAIDKFEDALKLKESMVGRSVVETRTSTSRQTKQDVHPVADGSAD